MHGAHRSRNVPSGNQHQQYKHGRRGKKAIQENSEALTRIRMLEQIGWYLNMFTGSKTRGRKPNGYIKLNLSDPVQMFLAISLCDNPFPRP